VNVFGKNRKVKKNVRVLETQPPDELRPAELGVLYDHYNGVNEIVSILFI